MKTLVTLALLTSFCGTFVGKGEELLAGDLARALGIHWCVVQLPPADGPLKLRFVIQFSDGKRELSGAMGGFKPGSKVNAYFWPAEDSERLNVAITSETGVMRTTIMNPASSIMIYPVNAGATTELGSYIFKGS